MSDQLSAAGAPSAGDALFDPGPHSLLLLAIARADAPVVVFQARSALVEAGTDVSESTVARRLRELDAAGLTILLGKQGRVLTQAGSAHVGQLLATRRREEQIRAATTVHTSEALLDLLRVRRAVEPEAVREAAERATEEDINALRTMQREYVRRVAEGKDLPRDLALEFHRRVTDIARNPLLQATLSVALDRRLDRVEAALDVVLQRHHVHEVSAQAHERILDAIEARDGAQAEELMRTHLTAMVAEVEKFTVEDDVGLLDRLLTWSAR
jgi:DNA-binding FadR family transcriptional regulator